MMLSKPTLIFSFSKSFIASIPPRIFDTFTWENAFTASVYNAEDIFMFEASHPPSSEMRFVRRNIVSWATAWFPLSVTLFLLVM